MAYPAARDPTWYHPVTQQLQTVAATEGPAKIVQHSGKYRDQEQASDSSVACDVLGTQLGWLSTFALQAKIVPSLRRSAIA